MCGVAGFVGTFSPETLRQYVRALNHRGPDDSGEWFCQKMKVGFAHTRLAIIDLTPTGKQPMHDGRGLATIVFNGEIYNFKELRKSLEMRGERFVGTSDTEVILRLYLKEGVGFVKKLNGMFAFAIWDHRGPGKLVVARDRFGIKPLYWRSSKSGFEFASEVKALSKPEGGQSADMFSLACFLKMKYVPGSMTGFTNIQKLRPGELLIVEEGRIFRELYWEYTLIQDNTFEDERATSIVVRAAVEEAIRDQMVADVPIGAFLSGGLDSAITTAVMKRHSTQPLKCFTVRYTGVIDAEEKNEDARAASFARFLGAEHTSVNCSMEQCVEMLPALCYALDEPIAEPLLCPTYLLAKSAARDVKVVLTGEGADELFCGYSRFKAASVAAVMSSWPSKVIDRLYKMGGRLFDPNDVRMRLLRVAAGHESAAAWYSVFSDDEIFVLTGVPDISRQLAELEELHLPTNAIDAMEMIEVRWRMPEYILTRADKMTMASSLEMRPVFLDNRIAELSRRIPFSMKGGGLGCGKRILRSAFAKGMLPVGYQKSKKIAFSAPLEAWIGEITNKHLIGASKNERLFDHARISRVTSRRNRKSRWQEKLFGLAIAEIWYAQCIANTR